MLERIAHEFALIHHSVTLQMFLLRISQRRFDALEFLLPTLLFDMAHLGGADYLLRLLAEVRGQFSMLQLHRFVRDRRQFAVARLVPGDLRGAYASSEA